MELNSTDIIILSSYSWIAHFQASAPIPLWLSSQATNSYMIAGNLDQDSRRTQLKYWVWASSRVDVELSWIVKSWKLNA